MAKMGRPSKANEDIKKDVIAHIQAGLSIEDTAKLLHIVKSTIYEWKKTDKDFSNALEARKQDTIQNELKKIFNVKDLAKLMKKKASGFKYTETTRTYDADMNITGTKKVEKLCPPDSDMIKEVRDILVGTESGEGNELTINLIRKELNSSES